MIPFRPAFKTSACLAMLGMTMPLLLAGTNDASASISHAMPYAIQEESSMNCDVQIENGKVTVKIDGKEVSDDRIELTDNGIVILGTNGEPIQELSLPAEALKAMKSSFAEKDEPKKKDAPQKAMLGITIEPEEIGVLIAEVRPGTPATRSGLKRGDVITKVMGKPATEEILKQAIAERGAGKTIMLNLTRDGKSMRKRVKLAAWDDSKMNAVDVEETTRKVVEAMRERDDSRDLEEEMMGAENMRSFILDRMGDIGIDGDIDINVEMIVDEMLGEMDDENFRRMMNDGEQIVMETPDGMVVMGMSVDGEGDEDLDLEQVMMILREMSGEEMEEGDWDEHDEWEHEREEGHEDEFWHMIEEEISGLHHMMNERGEAFHHEMAGAMEEMHHHFDRRLIEVEEESHNRYRETMGHMEEMMNHAREAIEHRFGDIHAHFENFGNQARMGMEEMGRGMQEMANKMRHGMEDMGHNFQRAIQEIHENQKRQWHEMERAISESHQRERHLHQRIDQLEQQVRQLMRHIQGSQNGEHRERRMNRGNRGSRGDMRGQRNNHGNDREARNEEREREFIREREQMEREREESNRERSRGQRNRGSRDRDQDDR